MLTVGTPSIGSAFVKRLNYSYPVHVVRGGGVHLEPPTDWTANDSYGTLSSVGGAFRRPRSPQPIQSETDAGMVWIVVALGGAIGSLARHAVNHLMSGYELSTQFPLGTVAVNLAGCFIIGLLTGLLARNRIELRFYSREFVFVGLIGGFTTFSTFGLDTFTLAHTHSSIAAATNIAVQLGGGLGAVWAGYYLGAATVLGL